MLILLTKKCLIFYNPNIKYLLQYYKFRKTEMKINEISINFGLDEKVNLNFEGDIVVELNNNKLESFFVKYKKIYL